MAEAAPLMLFIAGYRLNNPFCQSIHSVLDFLRGCGVDANPKYAE
jgi:hypothetical protein